MGENSRENREKRAARQEDFLRGSPKPRLRMERITRFTVCLLKNIWGFRQSDWGFAVLLPMCFTGVFCLYSPYASWFLYPYL